MFNVRNFIRFTLCAAVLLIANCANQNPAATVDKDGKPINPHPAGSYEHFKAETTYPKTYNVWTNVQLLPLTDDSNSHIKVDLKTQRGLLMNDGEVVLDYPICSGIKSRPTPTGTFYIIEKVVDKRSNKYGRIYDAEGEMVNGDADSSEDIIPEGGRFEGAPMRYWMRLTNDGVGHHIGPVRRYPASHACIRGPSKTIPVVYSKVKEGTRVDVE
jgi:hypothetical protein